MPAITSVIVVMPTHRRNLRFSGPCGRWDPAPTTGGQSLAVGIGSLYDVVFVEPA
ncbi:MAG: hypothetical protein ACYDD6_08435 [Acidimicrobiales bacterium]